MVAPGFIVALFFSSLVTATLLPRAHRVRSCGTPTTPEGIAQAEQRFKELKASSRVSAADAAKNVTVRVAFHIISKDKTPAGGNVPDKQIAASVDVLNADYAQSGVSFSLVNTTRTVNSTWFDELGPAKYATEAMGILRVGGPETLNVYTVGFNKGPDVGTLGYASLPSLYDVAPVEDGVVILYSTVPGGTLAPFNLGRTLTHEVGHWVGLYHTFENGCDDGDLVSDTPAEESPAFGCPTGRNTCNKDTLSDPITNFMDYTDDACMDQFTPGQITRLRDQIFVYRNL